MSRSCVRRVAQVAVVATLFVGCSPTEQGPQTLPPPEYASPAKPATEPAPRDETSAAGGNPSGSIPPDRVAGRLFADRLVADRPIADRLPAPASAITTREALLAAIKEKNPKFQGELAAEGEGGALRAVAIHDPGVEDISPLKGMPLVVLDLSGTHVTDISPIEGMPLENLFLEQTGVKDIGPVRGMPLRELYLSGTGVEDLGPLRGMRTLKQLNVLGTKVSDLTPLEGLPLEMLWLSDCPIRDIAPLATVGLVSVTMARTKVSDLTPLKGHPTLQRLHIAGTEVTDLSPLEWMHLTRLIFTPNRIKKGIEFARNMPTLQEVDTEFGESGTRQRPMSPQEFWTRYDAGEFK
jgi:hypothetical protein